MTSLIVGSVCGSSLDEEDDGLLLVFLLVHEQSNNDERIRVINNCLLKMDTYLLIFHSIIK